ncbi:copper chaperone PCu(A)C [Modestobacter sp. SYSU DS0657]
MDTTNRTPRRRVLAAAAGAVALLGAAGCGSDDDAPRETSALEVTGGAVGPDEDVSENIKLLQVQLEYPLDGVYEAGEDASLFLGIANDGTEADTLVDVSGPDFADARIAGADGTAGGDDISLEVAANDNVYVGAEGMPAITLVDLQTELRSSESIPVTFTFERAGEVTIDAMVSAEDMDPRPTYDFPDPDQDPSGETPSEG